MHSGDREKHTQGPRGKKEHGVVTELHIVQYHWNEEGIERVRAKRDKAMRGQTIHVYGSGYYLKNS